jgi:hypothetical protein
MGVAALCIDVEGLDINPVRRHERQEYQGQRGMSGCWPEDESECMFIRPPLRSLVYKETLHNPFPFLWHPPLLFISHLNMVSILL